MRKTVLALTLGLLIGSAGTALAATSETVQATFAKFTLKVNGEEKTLKTDPLVVDGTSYLPVREVAGLLGADVGYDDATRTIDLNYKAERTEKPMATSEKTNLDEWILLKDLSEKYGVQVSIDQKLTLVKGDKTLVFPVGISYRSSSDPLIVNSEDNSSTVMIKDDQMYLNKTSLKYFQ